MPKHADQRYDCCKASSRSGLRSITVVQGPPDFLCWPAPCARTAHSGLGGMTPEGREGRRTTSAGTPTRSCPARWSSLIHALIQVPRGIHLQDRPGHQREARPQPRLRFFRCLVQPLPPCRWPRSPWLWNILLLSL